MQRLAGVLSVVSATWLTLPLVTPTPVAQAAFDAANASIPIDATTQIEVHTSASCVTADRQCYFSASANLRTPEGPTGFPPDLWARQTTTLRTSDELNYLGDSEFNGEFTRMYKAFGPVEFTTIYIGAGPVEKYQINGLTRTTDWRTGQPKLDADYIVCSHIQVVYSGVNLTSPDACAQTTYS